MSKITVVALTLLIVTAAASANPRSPRINRREHRQAVRINQGVRSGELTPREARSLRAQERQTRWEKRKAKRDGRLTFAERRHLNRDLNQSSRRIYRLKHNAAAR